MNQDFEKLKVQLDRSEALSTALTLLEWDSETLAPKAAMENTARMIGILAGEHYRIIMSDEVRELTDKLMQADDLTETERGIVKELAKDYERIRHIPADEYQAYSELQARGGSVWGEAKRNNDFAAFLPVLKELIAYQKKFAGYRAAPGQKLYDVLLNDFEEGFDEATLDVFFGSLREAIVPLLKRIREVPQVRYDFLMDGPFPAEKQEEFCRFLAGYIGFDFDRGVIAESEHPFTTNLHNKDVRFTNHYYEKNLESAIFTAVHEGGHAIYEMDIPDELTQTPVGGGSSMGVHESQSRFCENLIGRSKAFWEPIYGRLQATYPEKLGDIDLDTFIKGINRTEPGYVRTEADELTYSLHVMVRYEVEKKIFDEDYPAEKLPELWNDLYEEYLGIRPRDDKEGVLQDVHWAQGMFGYFPSYALGNAIGAQLLNTMRKEMDFEAALREGRLADVIGWLKEHVHKYGKLRNTNQILKEATGETFNASYYIDYLTDKYEKEYGLK